MYQAGGEWDKNCRKPRNKPVKTDFSLQQNLRKEKERRKTNKQNPLVVKELAAKIRLEAYRVLALINKFVLQVGSR